MAWFRSRSRLGSYLALFAIAVQLVLSFGHVHLNGLPGAHHAWTPWHVHAARAVPATADSAGKIDHAGKLDHAGKELPALADDFCPICALIHLAGTLVLATAPALPPLAISYFSFIAATPIEFHLATQNYSRLGARAPPLA
ncbi:MAG TPA: DUF2946 family protein [Xanthobacteraceae bacterium]|jgi:hypothetical protein